VLRSFLAEGWARRLDAGTAGPHVVDSLWSGRMDVADLLFSLAPKYPERRLEAFRAADQARRSARARLKRWAAASAAFLKRFDDAWSMGLPGRDGPL
jgi:hypothetical protein